MEYFSDQTLRIKPHLAVLLSGKVGNFVIITPLLRGLKEKYPDCILDFFGSETTENLEIHCSFIDWRFSLHGKNVCLSEAITNKIEKRINVFGDYDLAINCDEFNELNSDIIPILRPKYLVGRNLYDNFCGGSNDYLSSAQKILWDSDWNNSNFVEKYRDVIKTNYISEIFCRISYVETNFFDLEVKSKQPDFIVPDVLIHVTATRSAKMWLIQYWQEVIKWCEIQTLTVGLTGSESSTQQELYYSSNSEKTLLETTSLIDLRGKTSLVELAGAFLCAKAFISIDSGPLHIAAAVGCPTIAIFGNNIDGDGASPMRLWAPRLPNVKIALSSFECTVCQEHSFKNTSCLLEKHLCMTHVYPGSVIGYLREILNDNIQG